MFKSDNIINNCLLNFKLKFPDVTSNNVSQFRSTWSPILTRPIVFGQHQKSVNFLKPSHSNKEIHVSLELLVFFCNHVWSSFANILKIICDSSVEKRWFKRYLWMKSNLSYLIRSRFRKKDILSVQTRLPDHWPEHLLSVQIRGWRARYPARTRTPGRRYLRLEESAQGQGCCKQTLPVIGISNFRWKCKISMNYSRTRF